MNESVNFKFKHINDNGDEVGLFAKKGSFDGQALTIDDTRIPVEAIISAERRFARVALVLMTQAGEAESLIIAIASNNARTLTRAINAAATASHAEWRRTALERHGRGGEFRSRLCSSCDATLELSGVRESPQIYCSYCDTIQTVAADPPPDEADYHHCDECGLYAKPREFTVFYFYFLLVVWGYRYHRMHVCYACMRKHAWKMLFLNIFGVLGLPFAVVQLVRAYAGGSVGSQTFAGLDNANSLAKARRYDRALERYWEIIERRQHAAGVRCNAGYALISADRRDEAVEHLCDALTDCPNYDAAFEALCGCYDRLGHKQELEDLIKWWDPFQDIFKKAAEDEAAASDAAAG